MYEYNSFLAVTLRSQKKPVRDAQAATAECAGCLFSSLVR